MRTYGERLSIGIRRDVARTTKLLSIICFSVNVLKCLAVAQDHVIPSMDANTVQENVGKMSASIWLCASRITITNTFHWRSLE